MVEIPPDTSPYGRRQASGRTLPTASGAKARFPIQASVGHRHGIRFGSGFLQRIAAAPGARTRGAQPRPPESPETARTDNSVASRTTLLRFGTTPLTTLPRQAGGVRFPCTDRSRFALIDALNSEWDDLDRDRLLGAQGRSEISRWAQQHASLEGCCGPSDVLDAIRADPDPVLAALIGIHQASRAAGAATGDHLAGRIVLQTMLGKIVTMAARDRQHAVEDYVGQLWTRIGSYPLARRPQRIAANLALDTLKAVTGNDAAESRAATVPVTPAELELAGLGHTVCGLGVSPGQDPMTADPVADLTARRVLRTAEQLGLIDEPTCRLLLSVYAEGLSSADAAKRYGLTPATVRFRCSKAIRRMAQHAVRIADAA